MDHSTLLLTNGQAKEADDECKTQLTIKLLEAAKPALPQGRGRGRRPNEGASSSEPVSPLATGRGRGEGAVEEEEAGL
jgi:hypothetical protein